MSTRAKTYITTVIVAGLAAISAAVVTHSSDNAQLAGSLLLLTAILSTMKISLPRMTGTISAGFLPVLVSIAVLPVSDAVLLAALSGVVQTVWKAKVRPQVVHVAFNAAVLAISAHAAFHAAHAISGLNIVGSLTLAVVVNYSLDVVLVATVLCLVEDKPLSDMLRNCNFWALPYYFAGGLVAALIAGTGINPYWPVVLVTIPIMYLVSSFYRQFVRVVDHR